MFKMQQTMRWYGPHDTVTLRDIRESGVSGIVTALHQIPVGQVWPVADIRERQQLIREAGMEWIVVESLPVHEDIKRRGGESKTWVSNYRQSLKNLSECGISVVTYNFMPVLDWLRTHHLHQNPDGTRTLLYNHLAFAYFDVWLLDRPNAGQSYTATELEGARAFGDSLTGPEKDELFRNILLGLPGSTEDFTREKVLELLSGYQEIDDIRLRENLIHFLKDVCPLANDLGIRMAIHPDDPPFSVMGLPRVVSTGEDLDHIFQSVPIKSNGLCYCTGSLGARRSNELLKILDDHGDRIHFLHLRNVKRDDENIFRESEHLCGDNPMEEIMKSLLELMQKRKTSLPMRPDHGFLHTLEAGVKHYAGYSLIGRLKGLAELRGLELGLIYNMSNSHRQTS
jgi:mannonate dehydratase